MFSRDATVAGRYLLLYCPKYEQQRGDLIRNGLQGPHVRLMCAASACAGSLLHFWAIWNSNRWGSMHPKRAIIRSVYDQTFKCYWGILLKEYKRQTEGLQGNNWLHKMSSDRKTDWYLVGYSIWSLHWWFRDANTLSETSTCPSATSPSIPSLWLIRQTLIVTVVDLVSRGLRWNAYLMNKLNKWQELLPVHRRYQLSFRRKIHLRRKSHLAMKYLGWEIHIPKILKSYPTKYPIYALGSSLALLSGVLKFCWVVWYAGLFPRLVSCARLQFEIHCGVLIDDLGSSRYRGSYVRESCFSEVVPWKYYRLLRSTCWGLIQAPIFRP